MCSTIVPRSWQCPWGVKMWRAFNNFPWIKQTETTCLCLDTFKYITLRWDLHFQMLFLKCEYMCVFVYYLKRLCWANNSSKLLGKITPQTSGPRRWLDKPKVMEIWVFVSSGDIIGALCSSRKLVVNQSRIFKGKTMFVIRTKVVIKRFLNKEFAKGCFVVGKYTLTILLYVIRLLFIKRCSNIKFKCIMFFTRF